MAMEITADQQVAVTGVVADHEQPGRSLVPSHSCSMEVQARTSEHRRALVDVQRAQDALAPCGMKTAIELIGAVFSLVVPTGMTEGERRQWWVAAKAALSGIPHDLLQDGCAYAFRAADHPSKIVKAILDEVGERWESRKRHAREVQANLDRLNNPPEPEPLAITDQVDPALFNEWREAMANGTLLDFAAKHGLDLP